MATGALAAARAGIGRLLLVTGPAGAGKTHLAESMRADATACGMTALWAVAGRAGAPAYWPWRQVLAALPREILATHQLAEWLLEDTHPSSADHPAGRFALFADIAAVLADAGRAQPLLVVLDDLHEADAASLLVLDHLAGLLRAMPVVVVATVRSDIDHERAEWAAVWPNLVRQAEMVAVPPLTPEEISALLERATGRPAEAQVVDRIASRTGGNALFVCELVRLVRGMRDVEALPDTVRSVIGARVATLSPTCRRVLSAAAVINTSLSDGELVDVLGESPDTVTVAVDEAQRHGLLRTTAPGQRAFVHEIVRDAVYDLLPAAHRMHWHRIVADQCAAAGSAADAAHHYGLAGPDARAELAEWSERAGLAGLAALAYEDAAGHFRTALGASTRPGAVQVLLGRALLAAGDAEGARAAHLAAAAHARSSGDARLLAEAALGLGAGLAGFEVVLQDREQLTALEDALDLLGDRDPGMRAAVMARLSVALTFGSGLDRRAQLAADAVDLARSAGDEAALGAALAAHSDVIAGPDHIAGRLEITGEVVDIAQRLRDTSLELLGRRQRLVARHELGDIAGVEDEIRAFENLARAVRQPMYEWYVPLWRAGLAFMQGRGDEARALVDRAEAIGRSAGSVNAGALVPTLRFFLATESGDLDTVEALFGEFELDDSDGPWVPVTRALLDAALGDLGSARGRLDAAERLLEALPRDSEWLPTTAQAAEVAALVGGHPVATWLYRELRPYAGAFVIEGIGAAPRGSVERHLGLLAGCLGDEAAARDHFARALDANRRLGATLFVARTHFDAATVLDDPAHRERARELYAQLRVPQRVARLTESGPSHGGEARLARTGELWSVTFAGRTATVRDSKGLRDIAMLLAHPGRPVPAVELATAVGDARHPTEPGNGLHEPGDLGEVVDADARRAYRERLRQLERDADDADRGADLARSAAIAAEREALVAELSSAYGLGGRPRRAGSPVERARSTVTARIRDSIKRVEAAHPEFGRHLRVAIRTGTLCSYEPERSVTWQLTP